MIDASPAILSIAVLAVFALVAGGVWTIRQGRDRKRGALMVVAALVLLINLLILAWPMPASAAPPLPDDVAAFVRQRESCDHWLGEEGYDAERSAEIARAVKASCVATDRDLRRLRLRYARDPAVRKALVDYAYPIERPARAAQPLSRMSR